MLTLRLAEPGTGRDPILEPILVVLVAGLALAGAFLTGSPALLVGLEKLPSLVPGRLLLLLVLLMAEAGLRGGPIGLSGALKKLDLRRSLGVDGSDAKVSMVLSDNEGLDDLLCCVVAATEGGSTDSMVCNTGSSRKPCLEADRKPSKELSWSLCSSSSAAEDALEVLIDLFCTRPRDARFKVEVGLGTVRCPLVSAFDWTPPSLDVDERLVPDGAGVAKPFGADAEDEDLIEPGGGMPFGCGLVGGGGAAAVKFVSIDGLVLVVGSLEVVGAGNLEPGLGMPVGMPVGMAVGLLKADELCEAASMSTVFRAIEMTKCTFAVYAVANNLGRQTWAHESRHKMGSSSSKGRWQASSSGSVCRRATSCLSMG